MFVFLFFYDLHKHTERIPYIHILSLQIINQIDSHNQ